MADDIKFMKRALRLSVRGRHASPNPMVGCVIVAPHGVKVGEGYHERPGSPHAEVVALRAAGALALGATAYVTLEPCSHFGRTGPCADALIAAGIRRVVAAVADPDTRVSGNGFAKLRSAGVDVSVGLCEDEARAINVAFFKHRQTGLPYVIVKTAMTLDGRIATASGDSRWITSPITREWVHRRLRDRCDAIMVGVGTLLADDPSLTTRLDSRASRSPLRIIVDSHLRTPLESKVVSEAYVPGGTLIACLDSVDESVRDRFIAKGVKIELFPISVDKRIDLRMLAGVLGSKYSVQSLVVEGGAGIIAGVLAAGLVDRYIATIAPKLIGGSQAPGPIGGQGLAQRMADAYAVRDWIIRRSGPDILIDGTMDSRMV